MIEVSTHIPFQLHRHVGPLPCRDSTSAKEAEPELDVAVQEKGCQLSAAGVAPL